MLSSSSAANNFNLITKRLWSSPHLSPGTKMQFYNALCQAVLLYACETWTTKTQHLQRLETAHNRWIRKIKGVSLLDHMSTAQLHAMGPARTQPVAYWVEKFQLCWVGHLARREDDYLPKQLLFADRVWPLGPRPQGRPPSSFCDVIHGLLLSDRFQAALRQAVSARRSAGLLLPRNMTWFQAAQDKALWLAIIQAMLGAMDNSEVPF